MVAQRARPFLHAASERAGQAVAAGVGGYEGVHQRGGEGLRLVVAGGADQLGGAAPAPDLPSRLGLRVKAND